jgi:hypothetical protein
MTHSNLFRDNTKKTLFQENKSNEFRTGGVPFGRSVAISLTTPKIKEEIKTEQLEKKLKKKTDISMSSSS